MSEPAQDSPAPRDAQASHWLWRLDRGLSPAEQDAFFAWLAADPGHGEALSRLRRNWRQLDRLADWRPEHAVRPNPDLLAPPQPRLVQWQRYLPPLAAAAALAIAAGSWWGQIGAPHSDSPSGAMERPLRPENRRTLADGTAVKLNLGADLEVAFSAAERRVRLRHGEGFFIVTQDPARPFIVDVRGVEVRAVSTAFNVSLGSNAVEVLVAEGAVLVETPAPGAGGPDNPAAPPPTALEASQRASIALGSEASPRAVTTLSRQDMKRALSWQHGMMTFDQRPLSAIVAELNLLNEQQLVIRDPEVATMLFSGTIRSDNVAGFVRLLESGFRVRSETVAAKKIVLRSF